MAHNELGYTTLSVAEPRRGVSVGASSCRARSVTEDNVPSGRARACPERSVSAAVMRSARLFYNKLTCNNKTNYYGSFYQNFPLNQSQIKCYFL